MFKGILFDLDNTLVDFLVMKKLATEAAVTAMIDAGLPLVYDDAYAKLFAMYHAEGFENQKIFQLFLEKYHSLDLKVLSAAIVAYREVRTSHVTPYPHVRSTLFALVRKGLRLGVVSDAPRMQAWLRLTEMKLVDFFDVVLGLEDTGKLKPAPEPFLKALEKMKLDASEVLFVGDNPSRDILGAKQVGMTTVLAKYGQTFAGKGADYEIDDVKEILGLV